MTSAAARLAGITAPLILAYTVTLSVALTYQARTLPLLGPP